MAIREACLRDDQDLLGLRMKTIIKAQAERLPLKTAQPSRVIGHIECFTG
jgi:hypothetical protein